MHSEKITNQPVSLITLLRRGEMFSKKKFIFNGKARQKISPSASPPEVVATESYSSASNYSAEMVDFSRFDFMGIEEFLSTLMERTENTDPVLWRASCVLAAQLKGSRALLSLRSYLSSFDGTISDLDRLISTAYFIMNAENLYLLQLDPSGADFVVTHSRADTAIGIKISMDDMSSGTQQYYYFYYYFYHYLSLFLLFIL